MEQDKIETTSEAITIEPSITHTHTVIFLHGRGSNSHDFRDEFFYESQNTEGSRLHQIFPSVRWVLPTTPMRWSAMFQQEMSEWFDMGNCQDTDTTTEAERQSLADSIRQVWDIVDEQSKHVPPKHIYLGGISQGCAVAVLASLMTSIRFAGFIGVAGWLPYLRQFNELAAAGSDQARRECLENLRTFMQLDPIGSDIEQRSINPKCIADANLKSDMDVLLCHGVDDAVVEVEHGEVMRDCLHELGFHVKWQEDGECGHWVKEPEQIDAIVTFFKKKLSVS